MKKEELQKIVDAINLVALEVKSKFHYSRDGSYWYYDKFLPTLPISPTPTEPASRSSPILE